MLRLKSGTPVSRLLSNGGFFGDPRPSRGAARYEAPPRALVTLGLPSNHGQRPFHPRESPA